MPNALKDTERFGSLQLRTTAQPAQGTPDNLVCLGPQFKVAERRRPGGEDRVSLSALGNTARNLDRLPRLTFGPEDGRKPGNRKTVLRLSQ